MSIRELQQIIKNLELERALLEAKIELLLTKNRQLREGGQND